MKKYSLTLVIFLALFACQEDEVAPNPFIGSWSLNDPEINISFDVVKEGGVLNYYNVVVDHQAIPENEQTNNRLVTYDKFENGNGYGRIEITSRGTVYYKVSLIYNRFTEEGMAVYDTQVDIPSQPLIVLTDRVFTKNGL